MPTPTPAIHVEYLSEPSGEIVATEAAVAVLGRTRRWALLSAVVLFVVAGLGLAVGGMAGVGAIANRRGGNSGDFFFLTIFSMGFLVFTLAPLAGGICLMRLHSAIRRAYRLRRPQDLERVLLAQLLIWRVFPIAVAVVIAVPLSIFITLIIADGNWP